jgi:uncharacterized protein (DUF1501 family)
MRVHRRGFIRYASLAAAGNVLGLRPFAGLNAMAQTQADDYKALVCVFLFGGNDANNMLVPFDTAGYNNYAAIRANLALPQSSLLPLTPLPNFALHPSLPDVQSLFNSGAAALVANVGTPTSRKNGRTPRRTPAPPPDGLAASPTSSPEATTPPPPSP